jgi:membrane protein YqaA with SNARE-associated domain
VILVLLQQTAQHAAQHVAGHGGAHGAHHQSAFMRWILHLGPIGIFAVSFFDGWVIPLPIPGSTDLLLLMFIVRHGNPWVFATLAVAGSIVGGMLTWRFGKTGGDKLLRTFVPKRVLDRVCRYVQKRAFISILIATMLPPPVPLTPFALAAGALGVKWKPYLIAYAIGRTIRYGVITWLGVRYGRQILHAWRQYLSGYEAPIAWTLAAITAAGLTWSVFKYRRMMGEVKSGPRASEAAA